MHLNKCKAFPVQKPLVCISLSPFVFSSLTFSTLKGICLHLKRGNDGAWTSRNSCILSKANKEKSTFSPKIYKHPEEGVTTSSRDVPPPPPNTPFSVVLKLVKPPETYCWPWK